MLVTLVRLAWVVPAPRVNPSRAGYSYSELFKIIISPVEDVVALDVKPPKFSPVLAVDAAPRPRPPVGAATDVNPVEDAAAAAVIPPRLRPPDAAVVVVTQPPVEDDVGEAEEAPPRLKPVLAAPPLRLNPVLAAVVVAGAEAPKLREGAAAAVVDVAAAPKFNVGAAVDPVEAEVAVDNPKPPKAGGAVVFGAADNRGALRKILSFIPILRRKLSSLGWRSKRRPPGAVM